jgi:hypothetical protein
VQSTTCCELFKQTIGWAGQVTGEPLITQKSGLPVLQSTGLEPFKQDISPLVWANVFFGAEKTPSIKKTAKEKKINPDKNLFFSC